MMTSGYENRWLSASHRVVYIDDIVLSATSGFARTVIIHDIQRFQSSKLVCWLHAIINGGQACLQMLPISTTVNKKQSAKALTVTCFNRHKPAVQANKSFLRGCLPCSWLPNWCTWKNITRNITMTMDSTAFTMDFRRNQSLSFSPSATWSTSPFRGLCYVLNTYLQHPSSAWDLRTFSQ